MGEIIRFPGVKPDNTEEADIQKDPDVLPGKKSGDPFKEKEAFFREIRGFLYGASDFGKNDLRSEIEQEWWNAIKSGDLDLQDKAEERLIDLLGKRRGASVINAMKMTATIYEKNPDRIIHIGPKGAEDR